MEPNEGYQPKSLKEAETAFSTPNYDIHTGKQLTAEEKNAWIQRETENQNAPDPNVDELAKYDDETGNEHSDEERTAYHENELARLKQRDPGEYLPLFDAQTGRPLTPDEQNKWVEKWILYNFTKAGEPHPFFVDTVVNGDSTQRQQDFENQPERRELIDLMRKGNRQPDLSQDLKSSRFRMPKYDTHTGREHTEDEQEKCFNEYISKIREILLKKTLEAFYRAQEQLGSQEYAKTASETPGYVVVEPADSGSARMAPDASKPVIDYRTDANRATAQAEQSDQKGQVPTEKPFVSETPSEKTPTREAGNVDPSEEYYRKYMALATLDGSPQIIEDFEDLAVLFDAQVALHPEEKDKILAQKSGMERAIEDLKKRFSTEKKD